MTIPYYGKRNPGGLTAANPGDTLFFAFASYNDSGDSEALTGLAATDIECFKNGAATARVTDSGYSLISDTGQIGDRVGLYRFSVDLFNTSDDTGFFDEGSWYQVAVDAVTIDGKTVRFWAGSFEIGEPRANLIEINGDTGQATHLGQMADEYDTGRLPADDTEKVDTGAVSNAVWNSLRSAHTTAGSFGASDTGVNDRLGKIATDTDTGIKSGVWQNATRVLTANTNLAGLAVDVTQIVGDTGDALRLSRFSDLLLGSGQITFGNFDNAAMRRIAGAVWDEEDTGHTDTGTFGRLAPRLAKVAADTDTGLKTGLAVNVDQLDGDTGAADVLGKFAEIRLSANGQIDTGTLDGTQAGTIDSNIRYVNEVEVSGSGDTGANDPWGPA